MQTLKMFVLFFVLLSLTGCFGSIHVTNCINTTIYIDDSDAIRGAATAKLR